jgi:hypothetical protein
MSKSAAKLPDGKAQAPLPARQGRGGDGVAHRRTSPRQLTKVELELGDGRYLLAYAYTAKDA